MISAAIDLEAASAVDFTNEFRVSLPIEPAWDLLNDVERIAPCMPGAQLTGVDGDQYHGTVKIKVGPVTALYQGTATVRSRDAETHTMVMHARGRDSRGQGNADAQVSAHLAPDGDGTLVAVTTHLSVTGKVAQFGKGVIEDISKKLMSQFAACIEAKLTEQRELAPAARTVAPAPESAPPASELAGPAQTSESAAAPVSSSQPPALTPSSPVPATESAAPLNLMSVARGAILKRLVPVVVVILVAIGLIVWLA